MIETNFELGAVVTCNSCENNGQIMTMQDEVVGTHEFTTGELDGFWLADQSGKLACPECREDAQDDI